MKWTESEIELLKKEYPHRKGKELAEISNRERSSVISMASQLGLKKSEEHLKKIHILCSERMKGNNPMQREEVLARFERKKDYCIDCGKEVYKGSERCKSCYYSLIRNNPEMTSMFGKHLSEETKIKIGKALLGKENKKLSDSLKRLYSSGEIEVWNKTKEHPKYQEWINKVIEIGHNNRGMTSNFKGKQHSEENKEKNRLAHLGKKASEETRKKMSISRKGKIFTEEHKKNLSISRHNLYENPETMKKLLERFTERPTCFEKKISDLCIENNLPFIYSGDGTFLIGHKNPDFINKDKKIAIEVYHDYFKEKVFGSCEEYEKQRSEYFNKYGWKVIFLRTEDVLSKNWEEICLNKIIEVKNEK